MTGTEGGVGRLALPMALVGVAALALTLVSGVEHDYIAYTGIWDDILATRGARRDLAYGPAFGLFALPYALHPLLPKLLGTLAWLGTSRWLVLRFDDPRWARAAFAALFLNPFFWIHTAVLGTLDVTVATLSLTAVVLHARRPVLGGLALAVGMLIKLYPGALAPLLAVRPGADRKIAWPFVAACLGLAGAVGGVALALWGGSVLAPVTYGVERASNHLSIFRFLRSSWSPVAMLGGPDDLDALSAPVAALAWAGAVAFAWRVRLTTVAGSVLAMVVLLQLYKVGHAQFQAVVVFLLVLLFATTPALKESPGRVGYASLAYLAVLAGFSLCYQMTRILTGERFGFQGAFEGLNPFLSLPMFAASLWLVTALVREPALRIQASHHAPTHGPPA